MSETGGMGRNPGKKSAQGSNELTPNISDAPMTRRRYATRFSKATAARETEKQTTTESTISRRAFYQKSVAALYEAKHVTKEEHDQLVESANHLKDEALIPHLQQVLGEEKFSLILPTSTLGNTATNQRMAAFAAGGGIRQGGTVSGIPPGQIPLQFQAQRMMHPYRAVGRPGFLPQSGPFVGYGQGTRPAQIAAGIQRMSGANIGQHWNTRQGTLPPYEMEVKQEPYANYAVSQRVAAGVQTNLQGTRTRSQTASAQTTGEVAKSLMQNRQDPTQYQYTTANYSGVNPTQGKGSLPAGYMGTNQIGQGVPVASMEGVSNKRAAPVQAESTVAKAAKYRANKRPVEDPSAPDVGDMDAVVEADIHLPDEQRALLYDIPSQVASESGSHVLESNLLNIDVVKLKIQQIVRERGMQLAGSECVDVVVQGMEEKFEGFLRKALKLAIHRVDTSNVNFDSDKRVKTSDVRSKLREIKKKQEAQKASKLREEREKLEQLAETASKKELANNKELAAKVERVKREKQFNAETEAANRALSKAFGGLGFEKYHRMKKDKEAREAAGSGPSQPVIPETTVSRPPIPPTPAPTRPLNISRPLVQPPRQREEQRQVVLNVKDVLTVMSRDSHYCFSPLLYRLHL